jgi:hypothetical protein
MGARCKVGWSLGLFSALSVWLFAQQFLLAWRRHRGVLPVAIVPLIAIAVLAMAMNHNVRWILLGEDYTRRLYVTIGVFVVLTLVNAVYSAFHKVWSVAAASALVCAAWFFVGVVNSAV